MKIVVCFFFGLWYSWHFDWNDVGLCFTVKSNGLEEECPGAAATKFSKKEEKQPLTSQAEDATTGISPVQKKKKKKKRKLTDTSGSPGMFL